MELTVQNQATLLGLSVEDTRATMLEAIEVLRDRGEMGRWTYRRLKRSQKLQDKVLGKMDLLKRSNLKDPSMSIAALEASLQIQEESSDNPELDRILSGMSKIIQWLLDNKDAIREIISFFSELFGA